MTEAAEVTISLDGDGRTYCPAQPLFGEYVFKNVLPGDLKAVEVAVLWYTEGKGDEDLAVHAFWRLNAEEETLPDPRRPAFFETVLPHSPLSYEGRLLKIRWCVRVRAFLHRGKEAFSERRFRLGDVPAVADLG
ncbi:MAG: hypothetical protein JXB10_04975 [Pirellulales bacterium]|nr:hypothetical protein [Pirellulales bacterium]